MFAIKNEFPWNLGIKFKNLKKRLFIKLFLSKRYKKKVSDNYKFIINTSEKRIDTSNFLIPLSVLNKQTFWIILIQYLLCAKKFRNV